MMVSIFTKMLIGIKSRLLTFILFLLVPVLCSDNFYSTCGSILYSCGSVQNIGYPFWGNNRHRPKYCGMPEYLLTCKNNTVSIKAVQSILSSLSVVSINTDSLTLVVSQKNLLDYCYLQDKNNTRLSNLKVVADHSINLYYGCSSNCTSRYSYNCDDRTNNNGSTYYYFDKPSYNVSSKSCSCKDSVSIPINRRGLDELRSSTDNESLSSIMTKWPEVKIGYTVKMAECFKCEQSGGRCGSPPDDGSSNQFICYCPDGPQPLVCGISSGIVALVLGIVMFAALVYSARKRSTSKKLSFLWSNTKKRNQNIEAFLKSYGSIVPKRYTYANIKKITNSFKDKLGEGGYGCVYKGRLHDGRLVAVKKMKILKGDGKDFINEVLSISRTNHVNVVTLLGFCFEGTKRALVFEFIPNGSLEKFMFSHESGQALQWETMLDIALGIARGLDYLHRGCTTRILHFDIKPHNILLDKEFHPKITDFGLARLCSAKNSIISMSDARGTIGYIAPESDVYSYGMMLLDLVCGRKHSASNAQISSEMYFPDWTYSQLEVEIQGIINEEKKELERKMILAGLWCIQTYPLNRPPMNRVVQMLEGSLESLEMPPKPHQSSPTILVSDSSAKETTM
ncbi:LEAF RUST 10 DISEASE-RESISTANCE LOCUS RECEPTOR-LIKE PROTEIN KINASE-like 2.1 [Bienertia sinuspersici]